MATAKSKRRRTLLPACLRAALTGSWKTVLVAVAAMFLAVSCSVFDAPTVQTRIIPNPPPDPPQPYVIGKADVLDVIVWKQSQLSGTVTVVGDGTITIPLAGAVSAAGLTCRQLRKELTARLSAFTRHPNVTVRVRNPASRVYYVLGNVRHPGVFPLHPGEFLSQGLAEAGGLSDFADPSAIEVARHTAKREIEIKVNFERISDGEVPQADVPLEPGDTVTVP
jgi:polysaccharide biosynthesis/export protein